MSEETIPVPEGAAPQEKTGPQAAKKPGSDWISALYAIIMLFVLIAAFQLYFSMQEIIRTWISDQFVPVFNTLYFLVIIVVGIWLIRDYIRRQ